MGYNKKEIIDKCEVALKDVKNFYKNDFVNYRGKTIDTDELYTEIIAKFICDNIEAFYNIPMLTRKTSYKTKTHKGEYNENSNRVEEITAMKLFNKCENGFSFGKIGKIIDYQTPLKNKRTDEAGKIDLLSVKDNIVYILELKKADSEETMLRCVLEGYTYLQTLNKKKLLSDFGLPMDCVIKASPLVYRNGSQWKELQDERTNLKVLMNLLDSQPFYIIDDNEYSIVEE